MIGDLENILRYKFYSEAHSLAYNIYNKIDIFQLFTLKLRKNT